MAERISECVYQEGPQSAGIHPSHSTDDRQSERHFGDEDPFETPTVTSIDSPAELNPTPSTHYVTPAAGSEPPVLQPAFETDRVSHRHSLGLALVRINSPEQRILLDSSPSISAFSSLLPPTIPPEPWISLSFLGEEKIQVQLSETDVTDLDMRSYVPEQQSTVPKLTFGFYSRLWVLPRLVKLGVLFTRKKMEAFVRGDQSGTVLNRGIVSGAHVLGMLFAPDVKDTPSMVKFYARRTQISLECLAKLLKSKDYRTTIQSLVMAASSYILIRMTQTAQLYIQKSCDTIVTGDLRFVPTSGHPPEFSEDLHETLVTLSQTIYWANYLYLMRGGPEPRATASLEREFRLELLVRSVHHNLLDIGLISAAAGLSGSF